MILVDEAVERLNLAGRKYGVSLGRWPRRANPQRHLEEIEGAIAPLRVPREIRSFWNSWDPSTLEFPCLDRFFALNDLLEQRTLERPVSPAVLLPIADWDRSRVWVELASAVHPGGRIFRGTADESHVDLWAFDIAGFFEILAVAFERDLIDDTTGGLHRSHLEAVATSQVREHVSALSPRRIEAIDRSRYPRHWLSAEGLPADHFELRGPTHTVESFKAARIANPQLRATLRGFYENTVCGGPISGCVGTFQDTSGELQVFVPLLAGLAGAVGQRGEAELDVMCVAPQGIGVESLEARNDMQRAADMGVADMGNDVVLRLAEQMKNLDTSIVVTGLRPIR